MFLQDLNTRAQAVLRLVVDSYVASGEAVGSRTLSKELARYLGLELSAATIRNTMAELEEAGLLYSPHTSAGRLPTDAALRLVVNNLLEVRPMDALAQADMAQRLEQNGADGAQKLERASQALASLTQCAGLVAAPKLDRPIRQVEFVSLGPGRVLAVWVAEDGGVENRLLESDPRLTPSDLQRAGNYLTHHLYGRSLHEAKAAIAQEIALRKDELNGLTQKLVEQGLAVPSNTDGIVIVRGQNQLLNDVREMRELDQLRRIFDTLEQRETLLKLVEQTQVAEGVQIFIGAENELFNHSGCAMIVAPYTNKQQQVIGAIGVIGPARLNYGRIIPMVDFTAKILSGV